MRNFRSKLSEIQRLACIALDSRGIGAVLTDIGWVWRSDCVLSDEAAHAVARKFLADGIQQVQISNRQLVRNLDDFGQEINALDAEIAGLLPESEV